MARIGCKFFISWGFCYFEMLGSINWEFLADVLGILYLPSSIVTLEDGTDTLLQAVGYKLPHNTVQCPEIVRNGYTALRKPVFFSCLASTGFHRWATIALRVCRIHFVGAIGVSTQILSLLSEKEFDWQPVFPSAWSLESRVAKRLCKCYYVFVQLYIVTSICLSTGLLWTPLPIVISFTAKITHFVIYFIYLLIKYFLIFLFIRCLLLIIRLGRF